MGHISKQITNAKVLVPPFGLVAYDFTPGFAEERAAAQLDCFQPDNSEHTFNETPGGNGGEGNENQEPFFLCVSRPGRSPEVKRSKFSLAIKSN